jgi:hypothetical protein
MFRPLYVTPRPCGVCGRDTQQKDRVCERCDGWARNEILHLDRAARHPYVLESGETWGGGPYMRSQAAEIRAFLHDDREQPDDVARMVAEAAEGYAPFMGFHTLVGVATAVPDPRRYWR